MPSAEELVQSCASIPTLPEIYVHARNVVDDPGSTGDHLAGIIKRDPALSAGLLRVANDPRHGFPRQIETIENAVRLIGPQATAEVVGAATVGRTFSGMPAYLMDVAKFWRKSLLCALLAGKIAESSGLDDSARFYVAGLFRDIGHLVLYQTVPQRAQSSFIEAGYLEASLADVEQSNIGCDFAEVGGEFMRSLGLPLQLERGVRWQLDPGKAGDFVLHASIVHLAGAIADHEEPVETTSRRPGWLSLHPDAVSSTKFAPASIPTLLAEAQTDLQRVLRLVSPLAKAA
ncbi:MAG: HDOD domain-containing protein [Nitrospira sp.]|nr:HDOD domain-containing protein [Nitrospira sp.]MCP9460908.1 HDOD domain-containing protein [Nitrospira sp.]MCP9473853.1 HDOD domain-containing protein [Nitrospira sp.]